MGLESDAVVQVLLRERVRVTALAASIVRDVHAADDIFQQVVLSALEARTQFRDLDHVLAWSLRAARHRAVDMARGRHLMPLPDQILDLFEARANDPSSEGLSDQSEALHQCLAELTPSARELLQMKYSEGLTAPIIAGRLKRTADAIYQNLSRLHRGLRDCVNRRLEVQGIATAGGEVPE